MTKGAQVFSLADNTGLIKIDSTITHIVFAATQQLSCSKNTGYCTTLPTWTIHDRLEKLQLMTTLHQCNAKQLLITVITLPHANIMHFQSRNANNNVQCTTTTSRYNAAWTQLLSCLPTRVRYYTAYNNREISIPVATSCFWQHYSYIVTQPLVKVCRPSSM